MEIPFIQASCYWQGRTDKGILAIVFHHMYGTFDGSKSWFLNPKSNASAHYLIARDGRILQMIRDEDRAWHCGISWDKIPKERCAAIVQRYWRINNPNDYTIGIELEGWGEPFSDKQYEVMADLCKGLCSKYNIPVTREFLIGHYEVNPIDKPTDPTEMDWDKLLNLIKGEPMTPFDYGLYIKDNDLYMNVISGSINEEATIKNITRGTSWKVYCSKSPGNDGGPINVGMEECLYEVIAKNVVHQYDNTSTIPPVETCPILLATCNQKLKDIEAIVSNQKTYIENQNLEVLKLSEQVEVCDSLITTLSLQEDTYKQEIQGYKDTISELKKANRQTFWEWLKSLFIK